MDKQRNQSSEFESVDRRQKFLSAAGEYLYVNLHHGFTHHHITITKMGWAGRHIITHKKSYDRRFKGCDTRAYNYFDRTVGNLVRAGLLLKD